MGRQANGVGTEHIKPKPNVCAVARGPQVPTPLFPWGPRLLLSLREGPAQLACPATRPGAAQSLHAAEERWWRALSPELADPVPVFLMLPGA